MTLSKQNSFLKTFIHAVGHDPGWILALRLLGFLMTRTVIIMVRINQEMCRRLHFCLRANSQKCSKSFFLVQMENFMWMRLVGSSKLYFMTVIRKSR